MKPASTIGAASSEEDNSSLEDSMAQRNALSENMKRDLIRKTASFKNEVSTRTIHDTTSEESEEAFESKSDDDYDNAIEEEDSDEDWEDDNEESGPPSVDGSTLFQRVDSKPNLASRRSLLTSMMHQGDRTQAFQNVAIRSSTALRVKWSSTPLNGPSTSNSPQDEGLMMQPQMPRSGPIIMTTSNVHPPMLSPRTTRRNMLQTELTQSLRQNLLWERQQKNAMTKSVNKRAQSAASIPGLRRAVTTNDIKSMRELAANNGRVPSKIRECDLTMTQQAPHAAPEFSGSRLLNEMQVAEPTFPLAQPPTCLKCGRPGKRAITANNNAFGNAGRPYYVCSHSRYRSQTFITFDDNIGIKPSNPRCNCGYISRLSNKRYENSQFYCCPVGSCCFPRERLSPPLRTVQMPPGANKMTMNINGLSAESESAQPSSVSSNISNFFVTELTDLLCEDNVINTLLSVALNDKPIKEDKLQRNFRRILIQYGRNLKDEAESEEHLAAASFVRHHSSLLSRNICRRVASGLDDSQFRSLEESVERMEIPDEVDRFLRELGNTPEEAQMTPNSDEEVEDDIDVLHPYYKSLTELSCVKQFLVSGNAFTFLREGLHDFVNPSFQTRLMELIDEYGRPENKNDEFHSNDDLHSLIAELLDTDPRCIVGWTDRDETSWNDLSKSKFESWTREKWDWWPFKRPLRRLRPGEVRLHWTCVSSDS